MTAHETPRAGLGGAVSIGNDPEGDQEPFPDGEELPEDDEVEDEHRDPDPTPDEKTPEGRA